MVDGRFNLSNALQTIGDSENVTTITNSLLLGLLVVIVSDGDFDTAGFSAGQNKVFQMEMAGCGSDDSIYDTALHIFNGLDFVYAEARAVPADVPMDGKFLGEFFFSGWPGAGDEL